MKLQGKRILMIDDTVAIRTFMRISLQSLGVVFFEAGTARTGLELCKLHQPDLVVLDLGLPDRDGLDIITELKHQYDGMSAPKIIILSVRKEQAVKDKAYHLGADAYLTKPFMMDDLLTLIEQHIA